MNPTRCLVLIGLALLACNACHPEPPMVPVEQDQPHDAVLVVAGQRVTVELAADGPSRTRGLMNRASLPADHGMLFLFTDQQPRLFWMRDTLIGLDMIFLDEDGVVLNVEQASPGVERPGFPSRGPARFVLELVRGWCSAHGLNPGDRIEISEKLRSLARE